IPASLVLGQSFTITTSAVNDGSASDGGAIAIAFPSFNHPGDDQWVTSPSTGDAPGYIERAAGTVLQNARSQTMSAPYLVAEDQDSDWQSGESNAVSLTVQPQEIGTFVVEIRATAHDVRTPGCNYVTATPGGGVGGGQDQQGFPVTRFEVQVGGTPSVFWTQL